MVLDLKERYGIAEWCAVLYGKGAYEFTKNQKEINYSPLLVNDFLGVEADKEVVDDEYLNQKEKEYGSPFFWPEFINDRHIYIDWPRQFYPKINPNRNFYQIRQQFQIRIREIEKMLDETRPDFVLFVDAGAMTLNLLYHIARKRGIPTLVLWINRPSGMAGVTDNLYGTFNMVDKFFEEIKAGRQSLKRQAAELWIKSFREKPTKPFYISPGEFWNKFGQSSFRKFVLFVKNFVRKCLDYFDNSFPQIYNYSPIDFLRHNFILWKNNTFRFKFDKVDYSEDYVFFPLHQEPELNLLMFAPYCADQGNTALNIAQSIPLNCKLYVKDHPLMRDYRDKSFYKKLKKFPNIKIIDPKVGSADLIKNAKLVTTIGGTAGFEACFFKKPVITFSHTYYNPMSFVKHCKDLNTLPSLVKEALENHQHNEEEFVNFASAMLEDSFKIDFNKLVTEKDIKKLKVNPDLLALSDSIIKYLQDVSSK